VGEKGRLFGIGTFSLPVRRVSQKLEAREHDEKSGSGVLRKNQFHSRHQRTLDGKERSSSSAEEGRGTSSVAKPKN